jgi:hypothetical protein
MIEKARQAEPASGKEDRQGLSDNTIHLIEQLPRKKRARVEQVVRAQVSACHRNGCPLEKLDRIYAKAVVVVELEARHPELRAEVRRDNKIMFFWEPARRYDLYIRPRFACSSLHPAQARSAARSHDF